VETLAQEGHTVMEASNAMAAVQALKETSAPIDVVLLDYRLPDSSDLGLLENAPAAARQRRCHDDRSRHARGHEGCA
jgi:DNA-binding NtrC family response regulator